LTKLLITGGAGFVGSSLARHFVQAGHTVTVLDNLRRRGSERNVADLTSRGVSFVHGDVRQPTDLDALDGNFDALIEASAEPSVLAGTSGSPRYVLETNLVGAMNCLEFARTRCAGLVFISTSRVYSIAALSALPLATQGTRLDVAPGSPLPRGLGADGISESFACDTQRSYYGASKLAAELLCQEYAAQAKLPVVIDRCGVIAGPGQFGKTDQGVFTLWVARHHFGRPLKYTGFGGKGLQVRDLLHPQDLCELMDLQLARLGALSGQVFNIGGGRRGAVSLQEFTAICREATGRETSIDEDPATNMVDIPWYISDHAKATAALNWQPRRGPRTIAGDIAQWVRENESGLSSLIT
jgi:CDP-paratose 2-epimerase